MPQRDNVIGGEDQDISAEKTQDNPRHSPRKGSPKKKSPDHERTPRQRFLRAPALSNASILPPPTYNQNATIDIDQGESESMPSRESGSRSTSPVKKFADLSMADIPTEYEKLDGHASAKLKGVLTKYGRLREIGAGVGVVPSSLKVLMEKTFQEDDRPLLHAYTSSYAGNSNTGMKDYVKKMGSQAIEIYEAAWICEKLRKQEDDWNVEVQTPLLKLAVSNPKYGRAVNQAIIKTASIQPAALGKKHGSGVSMQTKKVDFAVFLEPSTVLAGKIHKTLKPLVAQHQSINQTMMSSLRTRPIAFSMETKPPFCGDETSDVQLSIWVGAGIERLRWMMRKEKSGRMPVFPALSMHGHDLYLVVYEAQETQNVMYGKMRLGGTDTITGVFQIIAAMDILVEWAHTDYREWFESVIS